MTPLAHEHGDASSPLPLLVIVAGVGAAYAVMAWRLRGEPRGWSGRRTASFLVGVSLLAVAVLPHTSPWPEDDLRGHMLQHLLIGMFAPTALVLGAPLTLLLRTVPRQWGRRISRVLHSRPVRVLVHPVTVLVMNVGGLVAVYCTPLHATMESDEVVHHAVHAHLLAAGYAFAWLVAGRDPGPRRPSVPARLVLLGVAITAHAVLSQLLYAGVLPVAVPAGERRGAAELMYYGGDIAELLLALALLTTWRGRSAHRRPAARTDDSARLAP